VQLEASRACDVASGWESLKKELEGKRSCALLTHSNADVDAVASALSLKLFMERALGYERVVLASWGGPSKAARAAVERAGFSATWVEVGEVELPEAVVLVDVASTRQLGGFEALVAKAESEGKPLYLVDHHAHNSLVKRVRAALYAPQCPSLSEALALVLPEEVVREVSCLLLAGIVSDTGKFSRAARTTFLAAFKLTSYCSYARALSLLAQEEELSERLASLKAMQRLVVEVKNDKIVAATHVGSYEGKVAAQIVSLGGDVVLVATSKEDGTKVVYRFSERVDAALAQKVVKGVAEALGARSWGGHARAGAIVLDKKLGKRELPLFVKKLAELATSLL